MIKQDILENQAKIAYLSIGTNLGNKNRNIERRFTKSIGEKLLNRILNQVIREQDNE